MIQFSSGQFSSVQFGSGSLNYIMNFMQSHGLGNSFESHLNYDRVHVHVCCSLVHNEKTPYRIHKHIIQLKGEVIYNEE